MVSSHGAGASRLARLGVCQSCISNNSIWGHLAALRDIMWHPVSQFRHSHATGGTERGGCLRVDNLYLPTSLDDFKRIVVGDSKLARMSSLASSWH